MAELKPCPFVASGVCDLPPCNSCFLQREGNAKKEGAEDGT